MNPPGALKWLDDFFKTSKGTVTLCLVLFAVVIWVFLPSLQGNFLTHDDYGYVTGNPNVNSGLSWANFIWAFSSIEHDNWHPLTWLSHMADVQIYDLHPWGHHLTNVLIHAANVVLVFLVFFKMTGANWRSLIIAGLFGFHPLRVESVAWISERKDVLSTLFWLLSMLAYLRFVESGKSKSYFGLTLLFFTLGLMSKTMLVTLPFVFLLLDYWPLKRGQKFQQLVSEKIPFFALIIVVSAVAYVAQQRGGALKEMDHWSFACRFENALVSYVRYLGKFFWPENLCCYYPHPGYWPTAIMLAAAFFVIGASFLAWTNRTQRPYLFVGWFWFVGVLVPVIGLVQLGSDAMADRYSYIPSIGLGLILVWGVSEFTALIRHRTLILTSLSAVALGACALMTQYEIGFWKSDTAVWNRAIAVTKENFVAHDNLGVILFFSDSDLSFYHCQEAVRINPNCVTAQRNYAALLLQRGRWNEGIEHFKTYLELNPTDQMNQALLIQILSTQQQVNESLNEKETTVHLNPNSYEALNNLAWFLATIPDADIRDGQRAISLAKRACELTNYKQTICIGTLAAAYAEAGQFDDAISTAQKACYLAAQKNEKELLQTNQELLELYRAGKPYRVKLN